MYKRGLPRGLALVMRNLAANRQESRPETEMGDDGKVGQKLKGNPPRHSGCRGLQMLKQVSAWMVHRSQHGCKPSIQFIFLTKWVVGGGVGCGGGGGGVGMTDDAADILFQSFLQEALVSSSGTDRDVHSLMLSS